MPYDPSKDANNIVSPSRPARRASAITKSDSEDLSEYAKALYCTVAGDLKLLPVGNGDANPITIPVTAGQVIPIQTRRVWSTGSTATVIGLFE